MGALPKIPGYKIEKKLADGGMATVYLGIQERLSRRVAIKILDPSLLKNKVIEIRFLQEAETAANMYHSNIISIFDIGRVDDLNYIVMEYLKETLKEYMLGKRNFCLEPGDALNILKPIIIALEYAHSLGIIHRDIKTENIMFRQDGTPVLTDFGIARALDSDKEMTRTGMSLGTPYYMSPEQCRAERLDGRSDIYSLGVVLFEILTGIKPYDADSPMAVALKHLQEPVPRLPVELAGYQPLIDKMMAKRKEDRIYGGQELIELMDSLHRQAAGAAGKRSKEKFTPPDSFGKAPNVKKPGSDPRVELSMTQPMPKPVPDTLPEPDFEPGIKSSPEQQLKDNLAGQNEFKTIPAGLIVTTPVSVPGVKLPPPRKASFLHKLSLEKIPVKKIVEIGILLVLLVGIFIIFFNLGSGSGDSQDNKGVGGTSHRDLSRKKIDTVSSDFSREFLRQGEQYRADYNHALTLYENGDFEKAREWIEQLKKVRAVPEVLALEEKINLGVRESKETSFRSYFDNARRFLMKRNFRQARENILSAKQIENTPEVQALEKRIEAAYRKYKKQLAQKASRTKEIQGKDDNAFEAASGENTIEAFRRYIDEFPGGRHMEEAIVRLDNLKEAQRLKKEAEQKEAIARIHLRRDYKKGISLKDVGVMMLRNNFFDKSLNKSGSFKNKYEKRTNNGDAVLFDMAAHLEWYAGPLPKEMNFKKADKWVKVLNSKRYGGYASWRLPTLEEAASLLRKTVNSRGLHMDPVFSGNLKSIWTGDEQRLQTYWVIRFDEGIAYAESEFTDRQVLPVRSVD